MVLVDDKMLSGEDGYHPCPSCGRKVSDVYVRCHGCAKRWAAVVQRFERAGYKAEYARHRANCLYPMGITVVIE